MLIAEIGCNHMGDMALATKMILEAKHAGADLCKFQLYGTAQLARTEEQAQVLKQAELRYDQALLLFRYGKEVGIEVFFSVFDVERVEWCDSIGVKTYKIAASMRDKYVLDAVWATRKPTMLSINDRKMMHRPFWMQLYCVSEYPATITYLPDFDLYDGFSDHSLGIETTKIAMARGASIIEKHFALDHANGPDAPWSMTPDELRELKRWEGICKKVVG